MLEWDPWYNYREAGFLWEQEWFIHSKRGKAEFLGADAGGWIEVDVETVVVFF